MELRNSLPWSVAILLLSALPTALLAAPASQPADPSKMPLPTMADLQAMHDAGQYRICLQQAVRVANLTGDQAKAYDKFALLLLRGDCLLHLEDAESALPAFEAARKSPDTRQAIEATATELLIRKSRLLAYRPTTGAGEAISIVADDTRRKAMAALLDDELKANEPKLKAARDADSLVPIMEILPTVLDLYSLEVVATGSDGRVRADLSAMGERARTLIGRELETVDERVKGIENHANQLVDANLAGVAGNWWGNPSVVRHGLSSDDRRTLRETMQYVQKIQATLDHSQRISQKLKGKVQAWEELIRRANEVATHAENVLAAE